MKRDEKKPILGFVGVASSLAVLGIIAGVTFRIVKQHPNAGSLTKPPLELHSKSAGTETTSETKKAYVSPPIKKKDIPFKSYTIDAGKQTSITFNKSTITIPPDIFCDSKGNDIKGKVDIKYREFHNPIDFFLSGIPMTYDSGGAQYTFVSAGMFEIKGEHNGEPVSIKEGKSLLVNMESNELAGKYNIYELDTVSKRWVYKTLDAKDSVATVKTPPTTLPLATLLHIKAELDSLYEAEPIEPRMADNNNLSFTLNSDSKDFPNLDKYKKLIFEVEKSNPILKKEYSNVSWTSIQVTRIWHSGNYTIKLAADTDVHTFKAYPVVDKPEYKNATTQYYTNRVSYLAALEKVRQEGNGEIDVNDEAQLNKLINQMAGNLFMVTSSMWRAVQVNNFGIWNSDCPSMLPQGAALTLNYKDDKNDDLSLLDMYLVDKSKNALFIMHPGHQCHFNPNSTNFAWVITRNGQIAIFTPEDFKKIDITEGSYTFNFKVLKDDGDAKNDFNTLLTKYL